MGFEINPNLIKDKNLFKHALESQHDLNKMRIERGWLGNLWGTSTSIPNNIAAFLILILAIGGLGYTCYAAGKSKESLGLPIADFWAIVTPLITLAIGYLFGDKRKNKADTDS